MRHFREALVCAPLGVVGHFFGGAAMDLMEDGKVDGPSPYDYEPFQRQRELWSLYAPETSTSPIKNSLAAVDKTGGVPQRRALLSQRESQRRNQREFGAAVVWKGAV